MALHAGSSVHQLSYERCGNSWHEERLGASHICLHGPINYVQYLCALGGTFSEYGTGNFKLLSMSGTGTFLNNNFTPNSYQWFNPLLPFPEIT